VRDQLIQNRRVYVVLRYKRKRGRDQMKRHKYQGTITLTPAPGSGEPELTGRMVVRAQHRDTHVSRLFSALITQGGESLPGDSARMVTMVVLGDDADDYLAPGEGFVLWRGGEVGHGMITRRIFV
jgi:hypothetical protein